MLRFDGSLRVLILQQQHSALDGLVAADRTAASAHRVVLPPVEEDKNATKPDCAP